VNSSGFCTQSRYIRTGYSYARVQICSLITFIAAVSLLSLSAAVVASEAALSLSANGISMQRENFSQIAFSYPKPLAQSGAAYVATGATMAEDSADVLAKYFWLIRSSELPD